MIFLNWRGAQGRETVDQVDPAAFPDRKACNAETRRLIGEYALAGMGGVYTSTRACKGWN